MPSVHVTRCWQRLEIESERSAVMALRERQERILAEEQREKERCTLRLEEAERATDKRLQEEEERARATRVEEEAERERCKVMVRKVEEAERAREVKAARKADIAKKMEAAKKVEVARKVEAAEMARRKSAEQARTTTIVVNQTNVSLRRPDDETMQRPLGQFHSIPGNKFDVLTLDTSNKGIQRRLIKSFTPEIREEDMESLFCSDSETKAGDGRGRRENTAVLVDQETPVRTYSSASRSSKIVDEVRSV